MKTLRDKVIIITGASSGIGEAMAKEYAAQGAKVVLGARSVQKLQLLVGDIRSTGGLLRRGRDEACRMQGADRHRRP